MFEVTPSPEFSAWFESLSPAQAEEVACALDLLAQAGVALGPSRTSRALLWYDGCAESTPPLFWGKSLASALASFDDVRELMLWQREVLRCLDSDAFRERLARLDAASASGALSAVENLKVRLKAARNRIGLQSGASAPRRGLPLAAYSVLSVAEERLLEERFNPANELKEAFFQVLRLVGLEPSRIMNSPSGLCELTIASTAPSLRVLFGLDAPGERIVCLLGEALTRAYYGDAVRQAEERWLEYCQSPSLARSDLASPHE
jgi:hypothetical protein